MAKNKPVKDKEEVSKEEEDVIELNLNFSKTHAFILIALLAGFGLGYATHMLTNPQATGAAVNVPSNTAGKVNLKVINDPDCSVCDPTGIIASLESNVGLNLNVQTVDYDSTEGKRLMQLFNLRGVPAYVFDTTIEDSEGYQTLSQYLSKQGNDYLLSVSPSKFTEPIADWTGTKPTVMLFVMSQCPFGVQAEKAAKPLIDAFGDEIDFQVHYIATDNGDGTFGSLHGQNEVNGDLRQVCIQKYFPDKFWDHLLCVEPNYTQLDSVWEGCATQNGIDVETIKTCASGSEGAQLLKDSIEVTNDFGATGSPTTYVVDLDGMLYRTDVRSTAQVQALLCGIDPDMTGCDAVFSESTATASGGC